MEVKVELVSNRPARKVGRERARPVPDVPLRGNAPTILNTQPVRNIWRGRGHWPTFIPSGYLYVPDVFEKIGEAIHGQDWTGEEGAFRKNVEAFPRPSVVFQGDTDMVVDGEKYREGRASVAIMLRIDQSRRALPFTNKEWSDATDVWMHFDVYGPALLRRRAAVIQHIHRRAEAGELVFYIRQEGEMLPVSRKAWNFEAARIEQRIETGLMNDVPPEFLGLLHGGKEIHFFARKDELAALLRGDGEKADAPVPGTDPASDEPSSNVAGQMTSTPAKKLKPVSPARLEKWVIEEIRKGASQSEMIAARLTAFPKNSPPSRQSIITIEKELGVTRSRGAPKKSY